MVCGVPPFIARLTGERRVQARARGADRAVAPQSRRAARARADHPQPRWPRTPSTATRAPTTCAPTSCASGAAGRWWPRRSPRSSPRCPTSTVTAAGVGAYAAATVASPRVPVEPPHQYGRPPRRQRHPATYTVITLLVLAALVGGILFAAVKLGNVAEDGRGAQRGRQDRGAGDAAPGRRRVSTADTKRVSSSAEGRHRHLPETPSRRRQRQEEVAK